MKKLIVLSLVIVMILGASLSASADVSMFKNPYIAEFDGEILQWDMYGYDGYTYVDIRDIAAIYDLFATFDGRTITLSDQPPKAPMEIRVFRDNNGILCVPLMDAMDMMNLVSDQYMLKWKDEQFRYAVLDKNGDVKSRIPFYRHIMMEPLNDAEPIIGESRRLNNHEYFFDERYIRPGTYAEYMPLEVYEKTLVARYLIPQYSSDDTTADIVYGDAKVTLNVKNIDNRAYFKLRDLGEVFDFEVDFINNKILLSGACREAAKLPEGLQLYNIEGVRYLKYEDVDNYLKATGKHIAHGYWEIFGESVAVEELDKASSPEEAFSGNQIPALGGFPGLWLQYDEFMLNYDFFAVKGLV